MGESVSSIQQALSSLSEVGICDRIVKVSNLQDSKSSDFNRWATLREYVKVWLRKWAMIGPY